MLERFFDYVLDNGEDIIREFKMAFSITLGFIVATLLYLAVR